MATVEEKKVGFVEFLKQIVSVYLRGEEDPNEKTTTEEHETYISYGEKVCQFAIEHPDVGEALIEAFIESIEEKIGEWVTGARGLHGKALVNRIWGMWNKLKAGVEKVCEIFRVSLIRVAKMSFSDKFYMEFLEELKEIVTSSVRQARDGNEVDRALVRRTWSLPVILREAATWYKRDFEEDLLKNARTYYSEKASEWISSLSHSAYMLKAEECLKQESTIAGIFCEVTRPKLMEIAKQEILSPSGARFLKDEKDGFKALLQSNNVSKDLLRTHRLYDQVPEHSQYVQHVFDEYITKEAEDLIEQIKTNEVSIGIAESFMWKAINLRGKFSALVDTYFTKDRLFHKIHEKTFEKLCNKTPFAELLASFCDIMLKKEGSSEVDDVMLGNVVVTWVAYLPDKFIFAEAYRKKLATRLLSFGMKFDKGQEFYILNKLKGLCGSMLTLKMEFMILDLTKGLDLQTKFVEHLRSNPDLNPRFYFNATLLNRFQWPRYKSSAIKLPAEMESVIGSFGKFYPSKTTGRKLIWNHWLGTCNLSGYFDTQEIELVATTAQAVTLLLFNGADRLTFKEIQSQLNIEADEDVRQLLVSLSSPQCEILNRQPDDVFEFNSKFKSTSTEIIMLPHPQVYDTKTENALVEGKGYLIDAQLMRIMKTRKVLQYSHLTNLCQKQLKSKFKPSFKDIKRRIEHLIEDKYLGRDKDDPNKIEYVPEHFC